MKRSILLLLLCTQLVFSLQFTSPQNGASIAGPANVTFSWDEQPVDFSIDGTASQSINATSTVVELAAGAHTATISNGNASVNVTITLTQAPTLNLTITTDSQSYEVGTSSRITMAVNQPAQLQLTITRNGQVVDTYTVNVQQQTDFLYTLSAVGNYVASISAQGAGASTAFSALNTSVGVAISGPDNPTVGRISTYAAAVSGGSAPYTYFWQFSDNTTSSGASADHVFSTNDTYLIRLLVQDSGGKQASVNKTVTAVELTYTVDVTVMGLGNRLLSNATVIIADSRGGRTATTNSFGEVRFRSTSAGNYTVNVTYNDTRVNPQVAYNATKSVPVNADVDVQFDLAVPATIESNQTNATNTTVNSTNNTSVAATALAAPVAAKQAVDEAAAALKKQEDEARVALETVRAETLESIRSTREILLRTEEKQMILELTGLASRFEQASGKVTAAASESAIQEALKSVPTDVAILSKDTSTKTLTPVDIGDHIQELYDLRASTEKEKKALLYNIEEAAKATTITTKHLITRVTFSDGTHDSFTLFERSIVAPEGTTFVEIIPKSVAADASELRIDGSHDVLKADPIVRFLRPQYSYYVEKETRDEPGVLPVPLELKEAPSLVGFVAVKLHLGSFARGGLYAIILGIVLACLIGANVYMRRQDQSGSLEAFRELTDLTISTVEQGDYALCAKYASELKSVHSSLPQGQQTETLDIMTFIDAAAAVHTFRTAAERVQTLISLNDTNAIVTAYEHATACYNQLSEDFQAQERKTIEGINDALESHLNEHGH